MKDKNGDAKYTYSIDENGNLTTIIDIPAGKVKYSDKKAYTTDENAIEVVFDEDGKTFKFHNKLFIVK